MARITIPYAVADFVDLRERGYYYVDKTDFIPSLEDYNAPVFSVPGVSARVCLSHQGRSVRGAVRQDLDR